MMEAVRAATPEDLPAIVGLVEALRAELTPMRGGRIWAVREARPGPPAEAYGRLLVDPASCVVVGTLDDVVVGFGVVSVERLADGGNLGVVSDLVVDAGAGDGGGAVVDPRRAGRVRRGPESRRGPGGAGGDRPRGAAGPVPRLGRADGRRPRPLPLCHPRLRRRTGRPGRGAPCGGRRRRCR